MAERRGRRSIGSSRWSWRRPSLRSCRAPGELLADPSPPDAHYANPEMSPDGQTVTFNSDTGLFAVDADGSHVRMLVSPRVKVSIKHDWSPEGNRIMFTPFYDFEQNPNVWTIGTDGTGVDKFTHSTGSRAAVAGSFSPRRRADRVPKGEPRRGTLSHPRDERGWQR